MEKSDLSLGMPVLVKDYKKTYDGTVSKIGRTLVTIKYSWCEEQFRIDTQHKNDDSYGANIRFWTIPQVLAEKRRKEALEELKVLGWVLDWQCKDRVPLVQLEKVVAILKEDATNVVVADGPQ